MVRIIWLILAFAIASSAWGGEPQFRVQADKKVLALGESLTLEMIVQEPQEPLSTLQLDELKLNFEVYAMSTSQQSATVKGREVKTETMTLTVYPLQSGEIALPSFHYMGKTSKKLPLTILDGSPEITRVIIKQGVEPMLPWVRQAAILYLDVYDDGSLQWTRPSDVVIVGAHVRPLADTLREGVLDGVNYTIHRFSWAVTPLRDTGVSIRFPMLDALKFGTRLRYEAPPMWFYVAPVPSYLPVHVPIGKPEISIQALPAEIILNRPVNWELSISGTGISEEGLSKLLSTIQDDENWHFYPLSLVPGLNEPSTSATQTFKLVIPFKAVRAGNLRLPDLNLPYFDPVLGKIVTIKIKGSSFKVVNPVWQRIQKVVVVCFAVIGLAGAAYFLRKHMRSKLRKWKSLRKLQQAVTSLSLTQALLDYDTGTGKMASITLQQWLQSMEAVYEVDARLNEIILRLESERYQPRNPETGVTDMAKELVMLIKRLKLKRLSASGGNIQSLIPRFFTPANKEAQP